jgi:hypothetical protein
MIKTRINMMLINMPKDFKPSVIELPYKHKKELGKQYRDINIKYNINIPQDAIYIK